MSEQKWRKVVTGALIGLGIYGAVKWVKKEKWTWKGVGQSAATGGLVLPLAEPVIKRLIQGIQNLPPRQTRLGWERQREPENRPLTRGEKLLMEELEDLKKSLRGTQQAQNKQVCVVSNYGTIW